MAFSELCIWSSKIIFNIFLFLCSRNSASWQCHSAPLYNTEFWLEFCHGWPFVISITSCKVQILYASSSCWQVVCSWASLLKPRIQQALLSFHHSTKHKLPTPLLHLSLTRCQSGSLLLPLTSEFCTIAAHVPYRSLFTNNTGKEGDCKSNNIASQWKIHFST